MSEPAFIHEVTLEVMFGDLIAGVSTAIMKASRCRRKESCRPWRRKHLWELCFWLPQLFFGPLPASRRFFSLRAKGKGFISATGLPRLVRTTGSLARAAFIRADSSVSGSSTAVFTVLLLARITIWFSRLKSNHGAPGSRVPFMAPADPAVFQQFRNFGIAGLSTVRHRESRTEREKATCKEFLQVQAKGRRIWRNPKSDDFPCVRTVQISFDGVGEKRGYSQLSKPPKTAEGQPRVFAQSEGTQDFFVCKSLLHDRQAGRSSESGRADLPTPTLIFTRTRLRCRCASLG